MEDGPRAGVRGRRHGVSSSMSLDTAVPHAEAENLRDCREGRELHQKPKQPSPGPPQQPTWPPLSLPAHLLGLPPPVSWRKAQVLALALAPSGSEPELSPETQAEVSEPLSSFPRGYPLAAPHTHSEDTQCGDRICQARASGKHHANPID